MKCLINIPSKDVIFTSLVSLETICKDMSLSHDVEFSSLEQLLLRISSLRLSCFCISLQGDNLRNCDLMTEQKII